MRPDHTMPVANDEQLTPLKFLRRAADVFPDRTAIVYGERTWTYRAFADEAERFAAALAARIRPGDRVAVLAPNIPELLIAHFAVPLAGGVLVAINSRLSRGEVHYILEHSGATVLLVDESTLRAVDGVQQSLPDLGVVVAIADPQFGDVGERPGSGWVPYAEFTQARSGERPSWRVADERSPISINYTSGTTGRPKGVVYTHRSAYLNALGEVFHNELTGESVHLWTLPMFHCNGWCMTWAVTAAAGTHVALRAVRAESVWDAVDRLGVTHLCGAPTVCSTIADAPQAHVVSTGLRITTAGAPPSPTIIARLESLGISVLHVYGLTEVYGPFTVCEPQEAWSVLDSETRARNLARQGVGMLQAEAPRVVDSALNDVPADGESLGEIVLRGNNVMLEYFRDPDATAAAFRGGWFHTGDLGVMHPDGYIQIKDRLKDVIISGGENISSIEIEVILQAHPHVLEAAVVGIPDDKWGERPIAYVVLREAHAASGDDLRAHVRSHLAAFKVPDRVVFLDALPYTATGKVQKFQLRDSAAVV